jgi:hypothetical protein
MLEEKKHKCRYKFLKFKNLATTKLLLVALKSPQIPIDTYLYEQSIHNGYLAICKKLASILGLALWLPSQKELDSLLRKGSQIASF